MIDNPLLTSKVIGDSYKDKMQSDAQYVTTDQGDHDEYILMAEQSDETSQDNRFSFYPRMKKISLDRRIHFR